MASTPTGPGRSPSRSREVAGPTPTRVPAIPGLVEQPGAEGVRQRQPSSARPGAARERDLEVDAEPAQVADVPRPEPHAARPAGADHDHDLGPDGEHRRDRLGARPAQLGRRGVGPPLDRGQQQRRRGAEGDGDGRAGVRGRRPLRNGSHGSSVPDATWDTAERVEHGQPRERGAAGHSADCGDPGSDRRRRWRRPRRRRPGGGEPRRGAGDPDARAERPTEPAATEPAATEPAAPDRRGRAGAPRRGPRRADGDARGGDPAAPTPAGRGGDRPAGAPAGAQPGGHPAGTAPAPAAAPAAPPPRRAARRTGERPRRLGPGRRRRHGVRPHRRRRARRRLLAGRRAGRRTRPLRTPLRRPRHRGVAARGAAEGAHRQPGGAEDQGPGPGRRDPHGRRRRRPRRAGRPRTGDGRHRRLRGRRVARREGRRPRRPGRPQGGARRRGRADRRRVDRVEGRR